MQNKITDLRNHLFAQLERLGDESITDADLDREISRARAIGEMAGKVTDSARAEVDFIRATGEITGSDFMPVAKKPALGSPERGQRHEQ